MSGKIAVWPCTGSVGDCLVYMRGLKSEYIESYCSQAVGLEVVQKPTTSKYRKEVQGRFDQLLQLRRENWFDLKKYSCWRYTI